MRCRSAIPLYGHLSLLVGADGAPLSKRHGATSVRELREAGYASAGRLQLPVSARTLQRRVIELLTLEQMAEAFELAHLQRASAHFEMGQLRHWQSEWVHSLSGEQALRLARADAAGGPAAPSRSRRSSRRCCRMWCWPRMRVCGRRWCSARRSTFEEPALAAARDAGAAFFESAAAAIADRPASASVDLAAVQSGDRAAGRGALHAAARRAHRAAARSAARTAAGGDAAPDGRASVCCTSRARCLSSTGGPRCCASIIPSPGRRSHSSRCTRRASACTSAA